MAVPLVRDDFPSSCSAVAGEYFAGMFIDEIEPENIFASELFSARCKDFAFIVENNQMLEIDTCSSCEINHDAPPIIEESGPRSQEGSVLLEVVGAPGARSAFFE